MLNINIGDYFQEIIDPAPFLFSTTSIHTEYSATSPMFPKRIPANSWKKVVSGKGDEKRHSFLPTKLSVGTFKSYSNYCPHQE